MKYHTLFKEMYFGEWGWGGGFDNLPVRNFLKNVQSIQNYVTNTMTFYDQSFPFERDVFI